MAFGNEAGNGGMGGIRAYAKNRLDFFMVSPEVLGAVKDVVYEDRLGVDFDHKEVSLNIGGSKKVMDMKVFDSTLGNRYSVVMGKAALYETLSNHLRVRDPVLDNSVVQLNLLLNESI